MSAKGLSYYQTLQLQNASKEYQRHLDILIQRAMLYNVPFLQNREWIETLLERKEESVGEQTMQTLEKLLLWLESAQEGALLSH